MHHSRIRGVLAARAENPLPQVLAELNQAFSEFRQRNDGRVDELVATVNAQQETIDALRLSGGASVHPGAGLRGGRRGVSIDSAIADDVCATLRGRPSATMTTQVGPDGGFTLQPVLDTVIDQVLRDISPMRSLARVVPLTGQGQSSWQKIVARSGAGSAWAGEEDDREDTDSPTLGMVEIMPHELYALPMLTNHVIEDSSFNLESFLSEDVAGEFALGEGAAFVNGDGLKKPKGFLQYAKATTADATRPFGTLQYVATGQSGAFATSNPADKLFDLVTALRPIYRQGDGVGWVMNSATANVVRKFKDGQGNYLWTNSITAGQPDRLCGYPVAIDEAMPDIAADSFSVAFGNWRRGYAIVDRQQLRLIVDKVTKKGWTKMYFSRRVGGGVVDSNAIKLLKFAAS